LKSEYHALGVDFDERNTLFDEALDVLPLHWSGRPFDYSGTHFACRGTIGLPRPVQQPIPIWIGGNSTLSLRRAATRAHGWMPLTGSVEMFGTVRSPAITSDTGFAARLDTLRELAAGRFKELDIVVAYHDTSIYDSKLDIERHRHAFHEFAELGATWMLLPGPLAGAPSTRNFLEAAPEAFI
jgi:alkanesulfonate monooxygenase SsuD/methylene tetrahydromethanopterin reductase-like flavin-dependent oxidoreductase (luciferase family)